jgi:hypothetical protein
MSYFDPQNPGIDGIDELTAAEEAFLTSFAGLPFEDGDTFYYNNGAIQRVANGNVGVFGITIDGGGSAPSTGSKGFVTIPFNCTIKNWYLAADVSGSCVIDVKRSGASIVGAGNKPTLTSAISGNAAVASWTSVAVTSGDIIEFNLNSVSTLTRVNLVIKVTKP